ncbi:hypothetical protein A2774_00190 [Candidatus Roizmanbacteria bacterium RIFCSPHIGHO2_01_FULL_39_12c]|uniref:Uncharacterized protein n=1 Tax=Candidatus Roizmanbacteria bacterium RIFCSPHIGHO2_01_FULL_39_12c TaxID=1802031 RepID=A0A1F7GD05_9BACT|nr:MAG: hypothetical protein A2774_00190 [Candidatus Roizmanbacteria bacterium RIFCSPHIGHO2_01_FULL_39_12c]
MQNMKAAVDHLNMHHAKWPATYEELVAECSQLSDFSEEDKKEFMEKLPKKTYNSAEEVMAAMGWTEEGSGAPPAGGMGQGDTGGGMPPAQGEQPGQGGQM